MNKLLNAWIKHRNMLQLGLNLRHYNNRNTIVRQINAINRHINNLTRTEAMKHKHYHKK